MSILSNLAIILVALMHIGFLVFEMFFWTKPLGLKIFGQSLEQAKSSAILASNQGLYNGFLAAGLMWALLHPVPSFSYQIKVFFLCCVIIAGIYGAFSVDKKILIVQAVPATIALALLIY